MPTLLYAWAYRHRNMPTRTAAWAWHQKPRRFANPQNDLNPQSEFRNPMFGPWHLARGTLYSRSGRNRAVEYFYQMELMQWQMVSKRRTSV